MVLKSFFIILISFSAFADMSQYQLGNIEVFRKHLNANEALIKGQRLSLTIAPLALKSFAENDCLLDATIRYRLEKVTDVVVNFRQLTVLQLSEQSIDVGNVSAAGKLFYEVHTSAGLCQKDKDFTKRYGVYFLLKDILPQLKKTEPFPSGTNCIMRGPHDTNGASRQATNQVNGTVCLD